MSTAATAKAPLDAPADKIDADNEIKRLAKLEPIDYECERKTVAERLVIRVGALDDAVKAIRAKNCDTGGQGRPVVLVNVEPWHEKVDGATLLTELSATLRKYVVINPVQADAAALWSVHSHAHDASDVSPILHVKSVQKRSGKTRQAEALERIVARPLNISVIRPAVLYRVIESKRPTLLLDEMDANMNQNHEMAEAYRGIINSSFNRAGARVIINAPITGGGWEPREFSTWAPVVLFGIGSLPDTVRDRSIEIEMVRKLPDQKVQRLRRRDGTDLRVLGRKAARWAADNSEKLRLANPEIPHGLDDRAADAWEPLFAIADLAGEEWAKRAREAALALSGEQTKEDDETGTVLLRDIRDIFDAGGRHVYVTEDGDKNIKSEKLVMRLVALEERSWAEFAQKPFTVNRLAALLRPYHIKPGTVRLGRGAKDTAKGYKLSQFKDGFDRYARVPSSTPNPTVTPSQINETNGLCGERTVTSLFDVTEENAQKASDSNDCDDVTVSSSPWEREL